MHRSTAVLALFIPTCLSTPTPTPTPTPTSTPTSTSTSTPTSTSRMLTGVPWQIDVTDDVTHKPLGSISIPLGAREKRPILIALHGAGDRPGWACGEWRGVVSAYPFIVCPHGSGASEDHLYWQSADAAGKAIDVMLAEARRRFADWIDEADAVVIVGFSMGTTEASVLAARDPKRYPRIVLAEGSFDGSATTAFVRAYHGERALFACTTRGCPYVYKNAARDLAKRGVPARVNDAGTSQHGMWQAVVDSLRRDWPWVVEGMPGWSGYAPPADDADAGTTFAF